MSTTEPQTSERPIEPLPAEVNSIQPGGGFCMRLELTWGYVRRFVVRRFFPGFVKRMAACRHGERNACPHDVLDPRDIKYYRNQDGFYWDEKDDPFAWRSRLPFVRAGLFELLFQGGVLLAATAGLAFLWWPAAIVPAVLGLEILWFFRNPRRIPSTEAGLVISPADGKIAEIFESEEDDEFIGGPTVTVGIFLSVFNVHVNRSPVDARVVGISYHPGKFLNALYAASARENERLELRIEETDATRRGMKVRQIAGAIARRIVCEVKPGEALRRGEYFGMIKLGSRTELVLPREPSLEILVKPGQTVKAGETVLARFAQPPDSQTEDDVLRT